MRQKTEERLPLCHIFPDHQMARELEKISEILDHNPRISALVLQDLCDTSNPQKGASGLSAEFVLRATLVKQLHGFSYEQLAFHLLDSQSFRSFVRHPLGWMPNRSTLQRNISKISEASWKEINTVLVGWAAQKGLEKGQRIRLDSTAVESDIHHPTDSALLDDAVRTVSRLLGQLKERQGALEAEGQASTAVVFTNHSRRAKRRAFQIANGRGAKRQRAYRDLLKVARKTYGYGLTALQADLPAADLLTVALLVSLEHYLKLMARVIDQTERRVLRGETVPAAEKVFSIFEEHTDIIKKGQREPTYGHKIFLTGGRSSLILNCEVLAGNPADVGQLQPLLGAHREVYGRYPRQMAADRGFYSQANLTWAKGEGIQDAAFDRKGSLPISEMVRNLERNAAMKHQTRSVIWILVCLGGLVSFGCQDRSAPAGSELGKIDFPTSGSPEAQEHFIQGALLLHSFEFEDAAEAFQQAQQIEPDFAMAYWGEALTHNHPLWEQQDAKAARKVLARLAPTPEERLAWAPSEREKDYLRTVEVLYGEGTKEERDFAYLEAIRQIAEKYPDDLEAASLHALATLGTSHDERDFRIYMRAAALAEDVFAKNPLHPGAAHYLIHSYDDPIHAPIGLRAARVYARIAPAAAHALHMPSHVFVSLGMWDEAVASNEDSWQAGEARVERKKLGIDEREYHSLWWLEYAYLQQGRYREARKLLDIIDGNAAKSGSKVIRRHLVALRSHYRVESRQWQADSIQIDTSGLRTEAVAKDLFVRGMSGVKTRDLAAAKTLLAKLRSYLDEERERAEQESGAGGMAYVGRLRGGDVMLLELEALVQLAEGEAAGATQVMQSAVAAEDELSLSYGPPYPVKPAHELFGEMLLELDRPEEAREQFEQALDRAPRRALSLLGLARAAAKAGDFQGAQDTYAELQAIWHGADNDLPELAEVRQGFVRR